MSEGESLHFLALGTVKGLKWLPFSEAHVSLPADVGLLLLHGGCPQVFLYLPKQLPACAIQLMVQVAPTASVRIASAMLAGILVATRCATLWGGCLRHFYDPPCCGMSQPMSALSTTMWLTFTTCVASLRYRFRASACWANNRISRMACRSRRSRSKGLR